MPFESLQKSSSIFSSASHLNLKSGTRVVVYNQASFRSPLKMEVRPTFELEQKRIAARVQNVNHCFGVQKIWLSQVEAL